MKIPLTLRGMIWFGWICVGLIILAIILAIISYIRIKKEEKQLGEDVKEEEDKQERVWSFWGKI